MFQPQATQYSPFSSYGAGSSIAGFPPFQPPASTDVNSVANSEPTLRSPHAKTHTRAYQTTIPDPIPILELNYRNCISSGGPHFKMAEHDSMTDDLARQEELARTYQQQFQVGSSATTHGIQHPN
jgi:hypothetical protein